MGRTAPMAGVILSPRSSRILCLWATGQDQRSDPSFSRPLLNRARIVRERAHPGPSRQGMVAWLRLLACARGPGCERPPSEPSRRDKTGSPWNAFRGGGSFRGGGPVYEPPRKQRTGRATWQRGGWKTSRTPNGFLGIESVSREPPVEETRLSRQDKQIRSQYRQFWPALN